MSIFEDDRCKQFISAYMKNAGKTRAPIFDNLNDITADRTRHILSCFLLGILVYKENRYMKNSIDIFMEKIPTSRHESEEERFLYIWMLVCLFHDFGYAVEENKRQKTKKEISKQIKQMPTQIKGVPRLYSKKLLEKYNTYRCLYFNKIDHGIAGGVQLYYDLCSLREQKDWEKNLEKDYSVAAWAIACHNIFYVTKGNGSDCYERMGLEKLIYPGVVRNISIKRHPFFYLLCLVDSIEPLKTFSNVDILKYLSIKIEDAQLTIRMDTTSDIVCQYPYNLSCCPMKREEYLKKALSLNDWLTDTENNNLLIIKINPK